MKYEIVDNISKEIVGAKVYRIRALKDFDNVKAGDLGGWIQYPHNLSQEGDCWIYENAKVLSEAKVFGNAKIFGNAEVFGVAKVFGNAKIYDNAQVYSKAQVYDRAKVFGNAEVYGESKVFDRAEVYDKAQVYGNAKIYRDSAVYDNAQVFDRAEVSGTAEIYGNVKINIGSIQKMKCDNIIAFYAGARTIVATKRHYRYELECGCFYASDLDRFVERVYEDGGYQSYDDLPNHRKDYLEFIEFLRAKEQRELPKNTKECK